MNREELMKEYDTLTSEIELLIEKMREFEYDDCEYASVQCKIEELLNRKDTIENMLNNLEDDIDLIYYGEQSHKEHIEWKDWSSHKDVYAALRRSVRRHNEEELNAFLEKVFWTYENSEGYDKYEIIDFTERMATIVYYMFDHEPTGSDLVYAIDALENDGYWLPYAEPFSAAIERLEKCSKISFK